MPTRAFPTRDGAPTFRRRRPGSGACDPAPFVASTTEMRAHAPLYAETIYLSLSKSAINGALKNMLPHLQLENVGELLANLTFEVQNHLPAKIILYLE